MIALSPEPQTRLIVVARRSCPAARPRSAAWRAGAWPDAGLQDLAHQDLVDRRPCRVEAGPLDGGPDGDAAELVAGTVASAPPNLPIGVRAALTR